MIIRPIGQSLSFATAIILVALSGCERPKPVEAVKAVVADAPGCDVARAYVTNRLARFAKKDGVLVDVATPGTGFIAGLKADDLVRRYNTADADPEGWPKDPPSLALAQAWLSATQTSPFAICRDFNAVVTAAGVKMGALQPGGTPKAGDTPPTQINFTVPVVSADGTEALVLEAGKVSNSAEAAVIVHLRKGKDGAWTEVDDKVQSFS